MFRIFVEFTVSILNFPTIDLFKLNLFSVGSLSLSLTELQDPSNANLFVR